MNEALPITRAREFRAHVERAPASRLYRIGIVWRDEKGERQTVVLETGWDHIGEAVQIFVNGWRNRDG